MIKAKEWLEELKKHGFRNPVIKIKGVWPELVVYFDGEPDVKTVLSSTLENDSWIGLSPDDRLEVKGVLDALFSRQPWLPDGGMDLVLDIIETYRDRFVLGMTKDLLCEYLDDPRAMKNTGVLEIAA